MEYTAKQIENAKAKYNNMLSYKSVDSYQPELIGYAAAEQRAESHNNIVRQILAGNAELAKEWKLFFLSEEVKEDTKIAESKAKKEANLSESADILAPIKAAKKMGEFGKWLNTRGNQYRNQHFSKKYTSSAVSAFLQTI